MHLNRDREIWLAFEVEIFEGTGRLLVVRLPPVEIGCHLC
jgi:hypothetical protein